jgi:hypothetical protein
MALSEQICQFEYAGMNRQSALFEYGCGSQRQQSHHRANLQAYGLAVRQMEKVIKEAILRIPHLVVVFADTIHGVSNPAEMLKEAVGYLLIHRVVIGQSDCNLQHAQAVERHPCSAVGLVQVPAGRERSTAIENSDIVEPEESAGKHIAPLGILTVDPPVEIQHQSLEGAFQEAQVAPAQL